MGPGEGSGADAVLNVRCFTGWRVFILVVSPVELPQRGLPLECRRSELGLALFLWSLHVSSLILMRPHGPPFHPPPVICFGESENLNAPSEVGVVVEHQ